MKPINLASKRFDQVRDFIYNAGLYLGYNTNEEKPVIVLYDTERNEIFNSCCLKELETFAAAYAKGYALGRKHGTDVGNVRHSE